MGLLSQGQQEGQQQEQQQEQLQGQRCPAHAMQVRAHASRPRLENTNQRAAQKNKLLGGSILNTSDYREKVRTAPVILGLGSSLGAGHTDAD